MNTHLSQLSPKMASPSAPQSHSVPLTTCSASPPPSREPFIPPPEQYAGDPGSCSHFLLQCSLVFDQQLTNYPGDRAKIAYIINLLRGKAGQWATALWESKSWVLESLDSFSSELCRVFDHPVRGQEAAKRLLSIQQGAAPAATYSQDFRIVAAESGLNVKGLVTLFVNGLSKES